MAACLALQAAACLPDPQSVAERRERFDRSDLEGTLLLKAPPANMTPVGAEFQKAKLLGYTLKPDKPEPGDLLEITFYWTAIGPIPEDYQVFAHGDSIGGNASRIHGDHFPAKGKYPTDVWREGDVVVDTFTMRVPPGYGPKQLGVFVGLYLGNYRVPLTSKGQAESDSENRSRAVVVNFP